MIPTIENSYSILSWKMIKLMCISFVGTFVLLIFWNHYDALVDSIKQSDIFYTDEIPTEEYGHYEYVFSVLEEDIKISSETFDEIDEYHHSHETEEEEDSYNHDIFVENTEKNTLQKIMIDQNSLNMNKNIVVSLKSVVDLKKPMIHNNTILNNDKQKTKNQYVYLLPVADAIVKKNITSKDTLKQNTANVNIARIYEAKKEMTLKVRAVENDLEKNIQTLETVLKSLNMRLPQKFHTLKADIAKIKILDTFKLSPKELDKRYPSLVDKVHELYRLQIFVSFLPFNTPVVNARRSSHFGYRRDPFTKKFKMHGGLDFAARTGTPVVTSGVGIVKFAGVKGGYGNLVDVYHGNGIVTRYAHLSRIFVKKGQRVNIGQKIAAVGSTGRSTGPHLHYEIRIYNKAINPVTFLNKKISLKILK